MTACEGDRIVVAEFGARGERIIEVRAIGLVRDAGGVGDPHKRGNEAHHHGAGRKQATIEVLKPMRFGRCDDVSERITASEIQRLIRHTITQLPVDRSREDIDEDGARIVRLPPGIGVN